ncbi:hypothetical protein AMS68_004513 [Peltaster fructicola]|uniref:Uncharacterized protein n=1 Tax=Peltaster fructicola TaxID=286661 RepID=A0A6H0XWD6_9PEZI|nr:hypothetical protein AMS68_004513 [Peltaster fructicola]
MATQLDLLSAKALTYHCMRSGPDSPDYALPFMPALHARVVKDIGELLSFSMSKGKQGCIPPEWELTGGIKVVVEDMCQRWEAQAHLPCVAYTAVWSPKDSDMWEHPEGAALWIHADQNTKELHDDKLTLPLAELMEKHRLSYHPYHWHPDKWWNKKKATGMEEAVNKAEYSRAARL